MNIRLIYSLMSGFDHGENDAFASHHAHLCAAGDGLSVLAHGFPVVAVDGYAAVSALCDVFAHAAFTPDECVGIAQPLLFALVQPLEHGRSHKP